MTGLRVPYLLLCLCLISVVDLQEASDEEGTLNEIDDEIAENTKSVEDADSREEDQSAEEEAEAPNDKQSREVAETEEEDNALPKEKQSRDVAETEGADNVPPKRKQSTEIAETEVTDNVPLKDEKLQELEMTCPDLSEQIIGGRASTINRHPYQVSMVLNGNSFCGGFIVSRDYVLTAAHCVRGVAPNGIRLRVGSTRRDTGGRIVQVSNVTVHPQYGRPRFDNDIAALRLARPLTFTRRIRPIRLPQAGQRVPLARLVVTGWGLTAPRGRRIPRVMMAARVPVVPHWLCRLSYGDSLTNNMFCAGHFLIGGISSCQVYEMYLIGYQFQVLSPIFTIHWGLQSRRYRPLWREKQNERNRKHFETFKRELFARYRKDPLHLLRKPPPKKPV